MPNFEQTFKNIDDLLYKDSGADSEIDYIEQTSWVLFLKYLDSFDQNRADEAFLEGRGYTPILDENYRWQKWAAPKNEKGEQDIHKVKTGPDLVKFVEFELFPYLAGFKEKHIDNPKTIEYKIGEIFSELSNKIKSGYNLREILDYIDELPLGSSKDKHELSHLYETKIKNMGNAGRNGGQYYTPRPLIRAMIKVTDPKMGETIYDAACGSAGFLCEAYDYLYERMDKTTANLKKLQEQTLYGKEKKNLAYIIGTMNMILHGIEAPNIVHTNTLGESIRTIQEKDRYNVILANPPFGGKERSEVQQNFDIKTGETAFLFMQHFIKSLKAGGRAAIVIKNTFLSNTDNASVALRQYLLESCNLHTVLDMPQGTFLGAGVKTVVLFFTKGEPTKNIWYYQLEAGRSLGKTNPLNDKDLEEFVTLQKTKPETEKSWNVILNESEGSQYDLSVKNPNKPEEAPLREPVLILDEMQELDTETADLLQSLNELVG
ncbi:type I restriction enzyme M protein [Epilithonimonas bovis DSM 19482]|uniref:site-specific DNA-methyltransferase (adenine-specific) n=1 Tax=Epilithonimonas bovis DSM 19482 TaxID=1121284 RepID=A0A1U7PYL6_9FLAO|nr:N-6 DNA methylase [Epilithonimonas bovis]SIT96950.1 type I restriction enzyme M protein [Epilithonimonas bovis DSM 19482]